MSAAAGAPAEGRGKVSATHACCITMRPAAASLAIAAPLRRSQTSPTPSTMGSASTHTPFLRCRHPPPPRTHTQTPLSQQDHDTPLLTRPNNHPFHDESASPRHIHVFIAAHVFGTHLVVIVTHFSALMSGPAARAIRAPFAHMTSFARPRSHTVPPPHFVAPHPDPPPPQSKTHSTPRTPPPFTNPHFAPGGLRRSFSLPCSVGRQQAP